MGQKNRLKTGGRIDRTETLRFRFNNKEYLGYRGDTLGSALLANGIRVIGRSFKYHRPRGLIAAGVDESNAYVQLHKNERQDPNALATMTELFDGLEAWSQNCWPSPKFDVMSVNNLLSPVLVAGFYYKTFIGPGRGTRAWMFFERFIRKAAGIGAAGKQADPDKYEKTNAFCDVLVIGSGPAGLNAALAAARTGVRVILAEQQADLGGYLLNAPELSRDCLPAIERELAGLKNVVILKRTCIYGAYDNNCYGAVQRVCEHVTTGAEGHQVRQRHWVIRSRQTVLASGAVERPIVLSGNDRPGVMLASAVRTYLNRYGILPGRKAAVFTNNDSAYRTARDLARAGVEVALIDARSTVPDDLLAPLESLGVTTHLGSAIVSVIGRPDVRSVVFGKLDPMTGRLASGGRKIPVDLVCLSGGWSPVLHLWSQRSNKPAYDSRQAAFVPLPDGGGDITTAGTCAGAVSLQGAAGAGYSAGRNAACKASGNEARGPMDPWVPPLESYADTWDRDIVPLWSVSDRNGRFRDKAFVDFQNDVTISDIDLAYREGYSSAEHLKRYTTLGMAIDQGKTSNVNALGLIAQRRGISLQEVGTTTFRPPYTPVAVGALAGHKYGQHFRPTRISPIHDWHVEHDAVMVEAGLWLRPWHYECDRANVEEASIREAAHVRSKVGIVDVSTLGKIAIQGPDAAEFLNRIYVNDFGSFDIHRVRYGVMLRDDGFVKDDGTIARLSENEYLVTTSTANAAAVLAFQEFLLQAFWTSLRVNVTCVTDQWAIVAVAGPHSRALLQSIVEDSDLTKDALPNMHLCFGRIGGVEIRIHRMSYSGELAYELYVEAGFGSFVWEKLMEACRTYDVRPYGTKAMDILRIEKGHVAGPEIDGRTTLKDLGLEGLARKRKSFVGCVLRNRSALENEERPTLVGLIAEGDRELKPGCILFSKDRPVRGHGEGYISSSCYSPALQKHIALGFLARGRYRYGELIKCTNALEGTNLCATVTAPYFLGAGAEVIHA